jgi:hypothetical protein
MTSFDAHAATSGALAATFSSLATTSSLAAASHTCHAAAGDAPITTISPRAIAGMPDA